MDARLRRAVVEASRAMHARGWVANHEGNVSARAGGGRFLCTPTAMSKGAVDADALIVVDAEGRVLAGRHRPFGELGLHLAVYRARPDAGAVVHAHPPHATALAAAGRELPTFSPEAVVSLGPRVPLVPFALPGPDAVRALEPFLPEYDVAMLAQHGTLAWGDDVEQALLRTELVENLARIALLAAPLGGPRPLTDAERAPLLAARTKAGLGPGARGR